ncbi:2TM domain-containing protein [Nonlabens dokdonensis]|jgi:uncharacterized membrane protein YjjP (DUF1212 family)|uniref:2TM domain-containing protein n=2 Tax=Nonlabens dokdonensis TaxID=328515 RepID=A0ABX5PVP8_9FLAO|nr:2TM domain-containing protein [Nonlabens dokdonensis]AGC78455.1 putative integron gene cassette protein [Nonlabens dokdonensis DSW-6]PZX38200.1 2TM domain-containing protein [Nonlabens dokdonensis]
MDHINKASEKYKKAARRVEEIKAFYHHLIVFTIINLSILAFVLLFEGDLMFFFIVSVLGWGIGLASHAIRVFEINPFTNKEWEKRKIQEILDQDQFNI